MLLGMAWRDALRNPTSTISLIVLMALSVLLATASAGLLTAVGGASDRLLEQANSPHVVQMHAGVFDEGEIAQWAEARQDVTAHQTLRLLTLDGDQLLLDGRPQTENIQQNSLMVPASERDLLLTLDGAPLTEVEPGTIWLPVFYALEDDLAIGDAVVVTGGEGFSAEFVVAGFHRDPIMNTAIASSKRLAISEQDFAQAAEHTGTPESLIEFWLTDLSQAAAFSADYIEAGMPSRGPTVDRTTFRLLTMIGEGLDAGVVILASVLLLVVGLLCLRLTVLTSLQRDMREIGVMKAVGLPRRAIRRVYLGKYAVIGGAACLLGLIGGMSLLPVMTASLTAYMGPAQGLAVWIVPVLTALVIFALVVLFILVLLRRLKRITAVEALHVDAGSSQRRRTPPLPLHRSRIAPVSMRLGLIGLVRRWRTSGLLSTVFAVAIFIVVVPLSAAMTISSPTFTSYMGIAETDLRVDVPGEGESDDQALTEAVAVLDGEPAVDEVVAHTAVRAETNDAEGSPISVFVENGDHTRLPISYAEGRAPSAADEIAVSLVTLVETESAIGDIIELRTGESVSEVQIVGAYQDITNGGRTARAMLPTEDAEVVWRSMGVVLAEGADVEAVAEQLSSLLPKGRISPVDAYRAQTLGPVAEGIGNTALLAAGVALALAALVTVMVVRLILASDAGQIAIARAVGVPDRSLRIQYAVQVLAALAVALPVGVLAVGTLGQGMFNMLFEGLYGGLELVGQGTSRIEFLSDPLVTYLGLPGIFAAVVAVAAAAACYDIKAMEIRTVVAE